MTAMYSIPSECGKYTVVEDLEAVAACRVANDVLTKSPKPSIAQHAAVVERRDEERAREVGGVVLDEVHSSGGRRAATPKRVGERAMQVAHLAGVARAIEHERAVRAMRQDREQPLRSRFARGSRLTATCSTSLPADPGHLEHAPDRVRRESGPVLDAAEALLFDRGDELLRREQRRRDVAVIRVDAEDVHSLQSGYFPDRTVSYIRRSPLPTADRENSAATAPGARARMASRCSGSARSATIALEIALGSPGTIPPRPCRSINGAIANFRCCHDRDPRRQCFNDRNAEILVVRRQREHIGSSQKLSLRRAVYESAKLDVVATRNRRPLAKAPNVTAIPIPGHQTSSRKSL